MKKRALFGVVNIIIGLLIAIGPFTIFKVCSTDKMIMKCYWTSRAEIGIGILFVTTGILLLVFKHWQVQFAISALSLLLSIIAILIPAVLIGGCESQMMACRSLTFPAIYLLSITSGFFAIVNSINLIKNSKLSENNYIENYEN